MEFKEITLGEISNINKNSYKKSFDWSIVNYLDTGNITRNKIDNVVKFDLAIDKLPSRAKRIPKLNSILYSTVRPNQEHYGFVENLIENFLVSTGFAVIDVNKELADPKYIYYLITQEKITSYLHKIGEDSVSTYPAIKPSDLEELNLFIPNKTIQIKVRNILSSLDKKIEINNKIIANLEEQGQAIFKSWFVDFEPFQDGNFVESELGMIPEGWEVKELQDIADFSNGYGFKGKDLMNRSLNYDDYKVFKQADIKVGGGFNPNNTKSWVSKNYIKDKKLERFVINPGELLMCMTDMKNNVKLLGNTALIYNCNEYIVNQRVGRIKSKSKVISPSFLYFLTNNEMFLNNLRGRANTGVQVNLSSAEIKKSKVIIPERNILKKYSNYSEGITILSNKLLNENKKLAEIRDALLPKLMSGEIDVSNIKIRGEEVKNE